MGGPGLTCAAGTAASSRGGQRVGARYEAGDGLAQHLASLLGWAQLRHSMGMWGYGDVWMQVCGTLTWQLQLWHPGSFQRAPGSWGAPRCQQRGADVGVPGGGSMAS